MSKRPVLKMKHRSVGPRKGTGTIKIGAVNPSRKTRRVPVSVEASDPPVTNLREALLKALVKI